MKNLRCQIGLHYWSIKPWTQEERENYLNSGTMPNKGKLIEICLCCKKERPAKWN